MAGDYARWTQGRFDGPVDVIGFSTGDQIAQYLAVDHGPLVGRLVLSDTGCQLGEDAKALPRAARDQAAEAGRPRRRPTWPHVTLGGWVERSYGCSASA